MGVYDGKGENLLNLRCFFVKKAKAVRKETFKIWAYQTEIWGRK
jgi:hypothetical protein